MQPRASQPIRDGLTFIRSHAIGMWRYKWISLSIAWIICLLGWTYVYLMPDVYAANARVFVDTENAIEDFLGGIATRSNVMDEVTVVVREIVSRPNLAEVARKTDLNLRTNTDEEFENLLTSLQERISVAGNMDGIFTISFEDPDRGKALAVVDTLLTAFVEGSLGADRSDTAQAQQFLRDQIEEYEVRLTAAEDRVATFRRENVEIMSGQRGDYFTNMQDAESSLQSTISELNLATERRAELRRQIDGEEPVFGIMSSEPSSSGSPGYASTKIRELELQLEELRLQYTDKHPRIGQILETIELLKRQEAEQRVAIDDTGDRPIAGNPLELNPVYQNMRIQLSSIEVEIAALRAARDQQQREVSRLKLLVDTVPQVEAELQRLNRDYAVVNAKHQELLQQLETANIGEDVSRSIDEVQFRVIDPPFSENAPVGPLRPIFLSMVFMFAVGVALAIAFLMNQLKPTFIGSRSVSQVLGIPVLSSVSLLQTNDELRTERMQRRTFTITAAVLLLSFSATTFYSDQGSTLLRNLLAGIF